MDVFEAIYNRHSVGKVKSSALDRNLIEKLLEAETRLQIIIESGRGVLSC